MKIGYSVEGSTDRAMLQGLRQRWCPNAELIQGSFRGSTHQSLRREYPKICLELSYKGAEVLVFLTDSDNDEWRQVKRNEVSKFPEKYRALAIHGIPDRNVECWICTDTGYVARQLGTDAHRFETADPKHAFQDALGIGRDKMEDAIADLVKNAPLATWLRNPSFEDFYEQVRDHSKRLGCQIENLRDAK